MLVDEQASLVPFEGATACVSDQLNFQGQETLLRGQSTKDSGVIVNENYDVNCS